MHHITIAAYIIVFDFTQIIISRISLLKVFQ